MTDQPEPAEPDDPTAYALARHIADHPMSTVQAAFRYLNTPLSFELHNDGLPAAPTELGTPAANANETTRHVGTCPGYETEPNRCTCGCEGCTHNCGAHQEPAVAAPATPDDGLREQIAAALDAADYRQGMRRGDLADAILPVVNRRMEQLAAGRRLMGARIDTLTARAETAEADLEQMRQSRDEWMDLGKNADRLLLRAMGRRDRYRAAWKSARIRAARNGQSADRLLDAANAAVVESGRAEATLAAVRRWAQAFGPTGVLDILDGKAGQ